MTRRRGGVGAWTSLTAAVVLLLSACAGQGSGGGLFSEFSQDADVTEKELEALVQDAALNMAQRAYVTGFLIYYSTEDRLERRQALTWGTRSFAAVIQSGFYSDPVAQLIDLWVLAIQQRDFFESGDGRTNLGRHAEKAVEACLENEQMISQLVSERAGLGDTREIVEAWAREHPLESLIMARTTAAPLIAQALPPRRGRSIFAASDTVAEGMSAIAERLETLQFSLPSLLISQGRMLADDVQAGIMDELDLNELTTQLDRAVSLAESLPGEINGQRVDTLEQLEAERVAILDEIDQQRAETLAWMDELRVSSFADVADLQDQIMADFDALAATLIASVDSQRIDTLDRLDATVDRTLDRFGARLDRIDAALGPRVETRVSDTISTVGLEMNDVIDRLFIRVAQLLAVVFLGALVLVLVARGWRRG